MKREHPAARLARLIREGRRMVAKPLTRSYFAWDARYPKWRLDKYPPNCACPLGMALLADGYPGPWDGWSAQLAAERRFGTTLCQKVVEMADAKKMSANAIALVLVRSAGR